MPTTKGKTAVRRREPIQRLLDAIGNVTGRQPFTVEMAVAYLEHYVTERRGAQTLPSAEQLGLVQASGAIAAQPDHAEYNTLAGDRSRFRRDVGMDPEDWLALAPEARKLPDGVPVDVVDMVAVTLASLSKRYLSVTPISHGGRHAK